MHWFHLSQNNGSICLHSEYPNWTVHVPGFSVDQFADVFVNNILTSLPTPFVVVALLFYVHGKHLRSCRDGQLT